ncbi:hypothetical protein [Arthrobacter sp. IK3]|uniref:hypothetical protein n=1 Tax=Arthrobacter sp. IK3 TaxID=3448169 RepID=UPI003EE13AAF
MTGTTARLSLIQGSVLITLDGPDGTVTEAAGVASTLATALAAGVMPVTVDSVTGWQDTVLVQLDYCGPDCCMNTQAAAEALVAVLGTAGIEASMDTTFERSRRYAEHWDRFLETAREEVSAALAADV